MGNSKHFVVDLETPGKPTLLGPHLSGALGKHMHKLTPDSSAAGATWELIRSRKGVPKPRDK
jgi:hypothetical protein